jgi:hypothetical protein
VAREKKRPEKRRGQGRVVARERRWLEKENVLRPLHFPSHYIKRNVVSVRERSSSNSGDVTDNQKEKQVLSRTRQVERSTKREARIVFRAKLDEPATRSTAGHMGCLTT